MGRKSAILKLPKSARDALEKMAANDANSLADLRAGIRELIGVGEAVPSESSVHRWRTNFAKVASRLRESREIARGIVSEVGEAPDGDQGRAMTELLSALVVRLLATAADREELNLEEVRKIARTVQQAADAQRQTLEHSEKLEAAFMKKMAAKQTAQLDSMNKKGELSAVAMEKILSIYGMNLSNFGAAA